MKQAKRISSVFLAAVIILSSVGCQTINSLREVYRRIISDTYVSRSDAEQKPETFDVLIDALDKRDRELFKSLFSKTTLRLADDLDKGLDYIFGIYEGEYVKTVYRNYSADRHYGDKNTALINAIAVIETTAEKYYCIRYSVWTVQEKDPDALGIYSLDFSECDKDHKGGGGGSWLAGITYPEREGAESVAASIACTMIWGEEEYLRGALSDEALAKEGIGPKITAFAEDYSKINSSTVGDSWVRVRDDGTFVYLMVNTRPRTFIVARMSQEQPDKMSGMKVTIVPVDASIPQKGIEPEETGLDFSKFPHPPHGSAHKK